MSEHHIKRSSDPPCSHNGTVYLRLANVYELTGELEKSGTLLEQRLRTAGEDYYTVLPDLARTYALLGRRRDALRVIDRATREPRIRAATLALAYFAVHRNDPGFECLMQAFAQRDFLVTFLNQDPQLDIVRADPPLPGTLATAQTTVI